MEYSTTIEINNSIKEITLKPALYMDAPLWEITLDDKNYILRKSSEGWDQSSDSGLPVEVLHKIGSAIEYVTMKDAS